MPDPSLNRQILRLGIPSMVATLSVPLIGIVDTAMVGHLSEVSYMGAVAVGSVIFDVIYWGLGFLRMGTTALVAQYYGAGDRRSCTGVLLQGSLIAIVTGLMLIFFRESVAGIGFYLTGGTEDVQAWGKQYFVIRALGGPMVLLTLVFTGFFRGVADAIRPMWLTIVVNVVNVGGDYVLIYGKFGAPEMGVLGAAWASVLAVLAGTIYGFVVLVWRYWGYVRVWPEQVFDRAKLRLMGATHFYLFGRTACLLFAQFFMLSLVARMGETALAANAVLWQIWSLVSFSVDGFAHAAETLVGNALGSRNFSEARQIARQCLVWGTGLGLGYTLAYAVAMDPIVQVFTDHAEVVSTAVALTFWVSAIMPLNGALFILDGVFIGANDLRYVFGAMILVVFGVFLPFILLFVYVLGWELEGVWVGTNVLMVGRFGSLYYRYRGDRWVQTFVD